MPTTSRIQYFPISFFAMIMGLSGMTIAWAKSSKLFQWDLPVDQILLPLTAVIFALLMVMLLLKLIHHPEKFKADFQHPVKLNFLPTVSISLILLGTASLNEHVGIASALWMSGTLIHLVLTLVVLNLWLHHAKFEIMHMNPAWFIPVVGNILVPITGAQLGYLEVSWFLFQHWIVILAGAVQFGFL